MTGTVYFIGAGPGAPDLLTVRAERLIRLADVVIYADSLIHPDVARLARADARVEASSRMTLEQMTALTIESALAGKRVARLQSGDPAVYGAMFEQLARLRAAGVPFEIVPGVSSAFAAAALLEAELTVPGVSQTIILTRTEGRTGPLPPGEDLRDLARHGASLALFLSGALLRRAVPELIAGGYAPDTPAAAVYRATWEDERIIRGRLDEMADLAHAAGLTKQMLLMVGGALDPALLESAEGRSHLYDPGYSHGRRMASAAASMAFPHPTVTGFAELPARPHSSPLPGGEGASHDVALTPALSQGETAGVRADATPQSSTSHGIVTVSVTKPGRALAARIASQFPELRVEHAEAGGARTLLGRLWDTADALVLVMAVGAAVRLVAPLLRDKRSDPGVVVVDDAGRFAISLLGGHRAEANALAQRIASAIGAAPVSTTAAEALGVPSVEELVRDQGWIIENDGVAVTRLAAAIVNGEPVGVVDASGDPAWWPGPAEQLRRFPSLAALSEAGLASALVVSERTLPRPYASNLDHWVLARPPSLVLGVGCSSGAPPEALAALCEEALAEAGISPLSVRALATIDRRSAEPAVLELAARYTWQIRTFPAEQLAGVSVPTPSETVRMAVGTPSVCEAAAILAAEGGELVQAKRKNAVGTVAIARRRR